MERTQRKLGWTVKGMLGMAFVPMGAVYLAVAALLWFLKAGDAPNDPLVFLCTFGGLGIIFLAVGLGLLEADLRRRLGMRRALEGGSFVAGKITDIRVKASVNVGRTHPRVVECRYRDPDTGEERIGFSRYLYFDPTDRLISDEVPVYLDRLGSGGVFVDIDAVLTPADPRR